MQQQNKQHDDGKEIGDPLGKNVVLSQKCRLARIGDANTRNGTSRDQRVYLAQQWAKFSAGQIDVRRHDQIAIWGKHQRCLRAKLGGVFAGQATGQIAGGRKAIHNHALGIRADKL